MSAMQLSISPTLGLKRKDLGGNSWLGPMYRRFSSLDFLSISWNLFFTADLVAGYSASSVSPYCTVSYCIPKKKTKEPGLH